MDSLPLVPPRKPLGLHQVSSGKSRLISLFWAQLTNDLRLPWFSIVTSHALGEIRTWASLEAIIFLSRVFLGLAARAIQWKLGRGRNYDHGWWGVDRERKKFLGPTLQNGKFSLSKHLVLKIWHLAFPLKKKKSKTFIYLFDCATPQLWQTQAPCIHMESSSLTRDQTQAPCFGNMESSPLDYQISPPFSFFF